MSASVQLSGTVCTPVTARCTRAGVWFLKFDVAFSPPATPSSNGSARPAGTACVRKEFGAGEAAAVACRTRAHQLRPGVRVTVQAPAATGRIALERVTDLQLPDLYDYHAKVSP